MGVSETVGVDGVVGLKSPQNSSMITEGYFPLPWNCQYLDLQLML